MIRLCRQLPNTTWSLCFFLLGTLNGIDMLNLPAGSRTLICFDKGCMAMQGITLIILGISFALGDWFFTSHRHWRQSRYLDRVPLSRRRPMLRLRARFKEIYPSPR